MPGHAPFFEPLSARDAWFESQGDQDPPAGPPLPATTGSRVEQRCGRAEPARPGHARNRVL